MVEMCKLSRLTGVAAGVLLLAACQTTSMNRGDTLTQLDEDVSVVVMPGDIQLSELTAGGLEEPNAKWTEDATGYIHDSLRSQFDEMGLEYLLLDETAMQGEDLAAEQELIKLHRAVGDAIIIHRFLPLIKVRGDTIVQPALPVKGTSFDWSLGEQVRSVREHTDADYALFVYVRDSYSSPGRVAISVLTALLGAGVHGGTQVGYASLVDLRTGELVWFNLLARKHGDLRKPEPATETVAELLNDFPTKPVTE